MFRTWAFLLLALLAGGAAAAREAAPLKTIRHAFLIASVMVFE